MNTNTKIWARPVSSLIIKAGLLAGTLDILAAFIYFFVKTGKNPLNVLSYVSKQALGESTFTGKTMQQVTGLLVHFTIAFGWTVLFFILFPRLKWLRINKFITAIVYGTFVWTMMNLAILPAWAGKAFVYKGETTIVNCLILMVAIGLPLSLIAAKYYSKEK